MTIASKTVLLDFEFSRFGGVYADVATRANIDATEFDFDRFGQPFWGVGNTSTPVYPSLQFPVRYGQPFDDTTTRPDINASEFDFDRFGQPFWAPFSGPAPTFNPATFFMMF